MRKVLLILVALTLCFSLCACYDRETNENVATTEISPIESTVSTKTQSPITEAAPMTETTPMTEAAPITESIPETEEISTIDIKSISIGETISTNFVEITFNEVIIKEDIKYSVSIDNVTRITGPDPISGQKYVCLSGIIKNISTKPLPVYDFFIGNFNLDGYTYTVNANKCDILDGTGSPLSEIDPLMNYTIRIYVAIPDELATNHSSCTLHMGFYDSFDNRELARNVAFENDPTSLCPYQYIITLK